MKVHVCGRLSFEVRCLFSKKRWEGTLSLTCALVECLKLSIYYTLQVPFVLYIIYVLHDLQNPPHPQNSLKTLCQILLLHGYFMKLACKLHFITDLIIHETLGILRVNDQIRESSTLEIFLVSEAKMFLICLTTKIFNYAIIDIQEMHNLNFKAQLNKSRLRNINLF